MGAEPIQIRIQDDTERTKVLRIDAESGVTRIHFPLTDMAQMLEGLKLTLAPRFTRALRG